MGINAKSMCWARVGPAEAAMIDADSIESVREGRAGNVCTVTLKSGRQIRVRESFDAFVTRLQSAGARLACPQRPNPLASMKLSEAAGVNSQ